MLFAMHRVVMTRCWSRRALSSMGVSMGVFSDITGAIGRTPLVKLNRVVGDAGASPCYNHKECRYKLLVSDELIRKQINVHKSWKTHSAGGNAMRLRCKKKIWPRMAI